MWRPNAKVVLIFFLVKGLLLTCQILTASGHVADTIPPFPKAGVLSSDTTIRDQDREHYEKIKSVASKRPWTDALYSVLFNEPESPVTNEPTEPLDQEFQPFDGLMIDDIRVIVLAPFGTNVNNPDSIDVSNQFNKTANDLHVRTRSYIVRSNLLFKVGDTVDPLVIAESEAFLRNTGYIHDARIHIDSIAGTNRATVTVVVQDLFSVGLDVADLSFRVIDVELFDKNFLGIGSRSWVRGIYNGTYNQHFGYGVGYLYNNFLKTFINLNASYLDQIWIKSFNFLAERPLQTSLHHFGQISYYQTKQRLNITPWDSVTPPYDDNFSVSYGYAFQLSGRRSDKHLALAVSYANRNPSYTMIVPDQSPDPLQYEYAPNQSFLMQYSFYSQRYYRQYMIHNFGVAENIAYGYNISGQLGYTKSPGYFEGMYLSLALAAGKQFGFGNLYGNAALSSHIDNYKFCQGILRFNGNYFTPLLSAGKSRWRQFVNVNYAKTINPVQGLTDFVYFSTFSTLNTSSFEQQSKGSERFMVNLETDMFTTLNLFGFRFLVFSFFDGGWLKMNGNLFDSRNFYWGTGLGLRIRNDLLVIRTIVLKIGYYPCFDQNMGDIFQLTTSEPATTPNFIPTYPQEIMLR